MAEASSTMPEALTAIQRLRRAIATLSEAFRDSLHSLMSGSARTVSVSEIRRTVEMLEGHLDIDVNEETFTLLEGLEGPPRQFLLRFTQEAMTNVVKHAAADRAWVRATREDEMVRIEVNDDGCGFTERRLNELRGSSDGLRVQPGQSNTTGVKGLANRADAMGGYLELKSEIGEGAAMTVVLPLNERRSA
jgi:signal transduction histidine kinase